MVVRLSGRDLGLYLGPAPVSMLVRRAEGRSPQRGDSLGGLPAFWMAAMDLIDKGITVRRGHRHSVTVPVGRGWILSLALPIAPAAITFYQTAIVHQAGSPETDALLKGLGFPHPRREASHRLGHRDGPPGRAPHPRTRRPAGGS
jgi:hypothetical protein